MTETLESSLVGEIDTSAPFESVREAATRFGGFGFWKPSSHNISEEASENDVDEANMLAKACELEKELIAKEGETLKVLKSLESTKAAIEELKSKLQEKENCDIHVLNQAKMNLCTTTQDLAAIRDSIELLNKRLEVERASLQKRLNSENAVEISREIQRLSHEAMEFSKTGEEARSAIDKALAEIKQTRNKIKSAEMRLVAARKMKEAARAAEAVAIAEIKAVGKRRRRGNYQEYGEENDAVVSNKEILDQIEETSREIKSSRRTIEEGLEKVNTAKMDAQEMMEGKWQWSEHRRRSTVNPFLHPNRRATFLVDVNGLNADGTSSSLAVLKPTMSIGQILSRKLLLAEESAMMNRRVSLDQILGKTSNGAGEGKGKEKRLNGKRKRFGLANLSVMLNKESKTKNKKKKIALNLR